MIKSKCKLSHPALKGILDVEDVVEISSILSDKEVVLCYKRVKTPEGKIIEEPDIICPPGSYTDWKFKSKNGSIYTGTEIEKVFGPRTSLFDIFNKID